MAHLARVAAHHSDHILTQLLDIGELREIGSHFVKSVHSTARTTDVSPPQSVASGLRLDRLLISDSNPRVVRCESQGNTESLLVLAAKR